MKTPSRSLKAGMTYTECLVVIAAFSVLVILVGLSLTVNMRSPRGSANRSHAILNIRNCQQAMRGYENLNDLRVGDPFTRENLEEYMAFPEDIPVPDGIIHFDSGEEKITPRGRALPPNGDHLWLRMEAPNTTDFVGKYGFDDISYTADW